METQTSKPAQRSGTFKIGGDVTVHRLGFGAMRITGKGVWGPPKDKATAIRVLKRTIELGIDFIDTADSYGPFVSEELICEALHPYPEGLVIATKAGFQRSGPDQWQMDGRPAHLRERCEGSLKRLKVERIDLFQLHRIDPKVPAEDQVGTLLDLQKEGKIRHIGLSEVKVDDIKMMQKHAKIASVQNLYNVGNRKSEDVLNYCTTQNIGFIPWFPLHAGDLAKPGGAVDKVAKRLDVAPSQVALAWLLKKSPVTLPIPGTGSVDHLEENTAAALIDLPEDVMTDLDGAAQ